MQTLKNALWRCSPSPPPSCKCRQCYRTTDDHHRRGISKARQLRHPYADVRASPWQHLPGNPTIVLQNMAGAGSLRAANFSTTLRRGRHTIGMFARGLAIQPPLDDKGIQFDGRKFNWIGSFGAEVSIALSWHSRPFKTINDAMQREMILAGDRFGRDSVIFPYVLNSVLGTSSRSSPAIPATPTYLLAVERGEADGTAGVSWSFSPRPSRIGSAERGST